MATVADTGLALLQQQVHRLVAVAVCAAEVFGTALKSPARDDTLSQRDNRRQPRAARYPQGEGAPGSEVPLLVAL